MKKALRMVLTESFGLIRRATDPMLSSYLASSRMGANQGALYADFTLDLDPGPVQIFEFWKGREIVKKMKEAMSRDRVASRIYEMWSCPPWERQYLSIKQKKLQI